WNTTMCGVSPTAWVYFAYNGDPLLELFPHSICLWGFYIDNPSQGWETRLFLSNLDREQAHTYEVFVLATNTVLTKSLSLGPSGIAGLTCSDLQTCGQAGWLYVQSNARIFGTTLFVINNSFGGGAFTAQSPDCRFGLP